MSEPAQPFIRVSMFSGVTATNLRFFNAWLQSPAVRNFRNRPTRLDAGTTAFTAMGGQPTYRAAASDADPEFPLSLQSPQDDLTFAVQQSSDVPSNAVWLMQQIPPDLQAIPQS
jgi:hypothetical protein